MIGLAAQTVARNFMTFVRAAVVDSQAELMAPQLWLDHELREFNGPGSHAVGIAPLKQRILLSPV